MEEYGPSEHGIDVPDTRAGYKDLWSTYLTVVFTDPTVAITLVCDAFGRSDDDQQLLTGSTLYPYEVMSVGFRRCRGGGRRDGTKVRKSGPRGR